MGRFSTRTVLLGSVLGLASLITGGGLILAVAEDDAIFDGVWLAFNVVTTTGYGSGPVTALGQIVSMIMFLFGASCWFGVLVVALEVGNMRFQKQSLINEALRPLARRPRNRLFHVN
ncbi:MAG: potassium channel family protein [Actinomycetota bacterium]|nr:potassium channel family protein [Actinomycetota bacterium]